MRNQALLILLASVAVADFAQAQPLSNQAAYANAAPADSAIYEVLARVEQLQSEVQQLRGLVEEQAQTIKDLERKQSNMYADLDGRVQALSTPAASNATPATQASVAAPPVVTSAPVVTAQPAIDATHAPSAPAVTQETPPTVAATPAVENTKPQVSAATTNSGVEKERYQVAYDTLRNGHNAQAVQLFEGLIADYPAGEYADNAQYWLGEAYKINRDYDKARAAFNKVVSQYPNSSKVPDALLKLGYIEADQQNVAKARDYLTRVTTAYPNTTAAHLATKRLSQFAQ